MGILYPFTIIIYGYVDIYFSLEINTLEEMPSYSVCPVPLDVLVIHDFEKWGLKDNEMQG